MMYGVSSMTAPLRKVALRKPGASLLNADPAKWHYGAVFEPGEIATIHAEFAETLSLAGVEIYWMSSDDQGIADAVFTYDASLMTPSGAVLMSPGKPLRRGEQTLHRVFYEAHQFPIIGEIVGDARAEAGDTLWLDDNLLIVGRGFRTNCAGVAQLRAIMAKQTIDVQEFDLPVYHGATACLHLMSLISFVDTKCALVCMPLLPVGLLELLQEKGITLLEAPFDEFEKSSTLSINVLAIAPGDCIMLDGQPKTLDILTKAGINVRLFKGDALCIGCEGGPTCLTRPLFREATEGPSMDPRLR